MRRRIGFVLIIVGIVAAIVGTASGCGSLFTFSGRHPILVAPLVIGTPLRQAIPVTAGLRYTLAVQVVFDRAGLEEREGALVVEAQLPLVASLEGVTVTGTLDPNEPPNVLYGQSTNRNVRAPHGAGPRELMVERFVGPWVATSDRNIACAVDLGPDRLARARVIEARIIVYDDRLPRAVTAALAVGGGGLIALVSGTILVLFGGRRKGRGGARRRPIV